MKRKLLIEVECGDCLYYQHPGMCFNYVLVPGKIKNIDDGKRLKECLDAEQKEEWDLK